MAAGGNPAEADLLAELRAELLHLGVLVDFPWHSQQLAALRAATDVIAIIGGNRSGKSETGKGAIARLSRREGPIYDRLHEPIGRTLRIWVAPQTFEKYKSLWESRIFEALEGLEYSYVQSPHPVFRIRDPDGGIEIWGKAQEQGFLSFESDDVDLIVFDEEPEDPRVVRSAKIRMATTHGVVILAFTPLLGMTWTHGEFYLPAVKDEFMVADRVWRIGSSLTVVGMGMADNPKAVAGGGVAALLSDPSITQAERDARLFGTYGFTEGLLIPEFATLSRHTAGPYLVREAVFRAAILKQRDLHWYLTSDPNKRHGALLSCIDSEDNRYYVAEHFADGKPDSWHANQYRIMLDKFGISEHDVDCFADPGGAGKQAIINLAEVGFFAQPITKGPGSVSASIKRLRRHAYLDPLHVHPITGQLGAPRIYFLDSLMSYWSEGGIDYADSRLMWEFRQYRQLEGQAPDTPIKKFDDVVDCARYLELAHGEGPPPREVITPEAVIRSQLDEGSRRANDDFDNVISRLKKAGKINVPHY